MPAAEAAEPNKNHCPTPSPIEEGLCVHGAMHSMRVR